MNDIGPKNKSCAVFEVSYNKVDKIFIGFPFILCK